MRFLAFEVSDNWRRHAKVNRKAWLGSRQARKEIRADSALANRVEAAEIQTVNMIKVVGAFYC